MKPNTYEAYTEQLIMGDCRVGPFVVAVRVHRIAREREVKSSVCVGLEVSRNRRPPRVNYEAAGLPRATPSPPWLPALGDLAAGQRRGACVVHTEVIEVVFGVHGVQGGSHAAAARRGRKSSGDLDEWTGHFFWRSTLACVSENTHRHPHMCPGCWLVFLKVRRKSTPHSSRVLYMQSRKGGALRKSEPYSFTFRLSTAYSRSRAAAPSFRASPSPLPLVTHLPNGGRLLACAIAIGSSSGGQAT